MVHDSIILHIPILQAALIQPRILCRLSHQSGNFVRNRNHIPVFRNLGIISEVEFTYASLMSEYLSFLKISKNKSFCEMKMGGKHNRWHYITWLPNLAIRIFEKKGSVNTTSAEKRHDLVRKPI
jgi:hypothetical protein